MRDLLLCGTADDLPVIQPAV